MDKNVGEKGKNRLLRLGKPIINILFKVQLCPNCTRSMKQGKAAPNPALRGISKSPMMF
jgi:hypothetical protein